MFLREVPYHGLSIARWVKFLPQHLLKSYKKKKPKPNQQKLNTVPLNGKKIHTVLCIIQMFNRIKTYQSEYCISLSKYWEGTVNHGPLLHGEKLDPHTRGKLPHHMPSTSGLWHFNKMPTPNRLGMDSNAPFASDVHQQRKNKLVGTLPVTREENNPPL